MRASVRSQPAQTKTTKAAADYREHPHGAQRCGRCTMFLPPMACSAVTGKIASKGWCKLFEMEDTSRQ